MDAVYIICCIAAQAGWTGYIDQKYDSPAISHHAQSESMPFHERRSESLKAFAENGFWFPWLCLLQSELTWGEVSNNIYQAIVKRTYLIQKIISRSV